MIWLPDLQTEDYSAIRGQHSPWVCELVKVSWPEPDGAIYYCSSQADEVFAIEGQPFPVAPVEIRFEGNQFLGLPIEDGISDSEIELAFWDADKVIRRLHKLHGPGHRVEVFYYFPEFNLLISQWHGHLGAPTEITPTHCTIKVSYGFRSALLPVPSRAFWPSCGWVFGGLLDTQDEIDRSGCPWNLHLPGGSVGVAGSENLPPCNRRSRSVCAQYLPGGTFYGGFDTVIESYPNGKLFSTARGNENNLKRPLRRVYGPQYVDDLDLLAFAVDYNQKHPDKGWVLCMFAICEGRVSSVDQFEINNVLVGYEHQTTRRGEKGQSKTFFTPNVNNYSGTVLAVGRIQGDFANTSGSDLRGRVYCGGADDLRIYSDPDTFVVGASTNPAWIFYDAWTNEVWGHGQSRQLPVQDVIDLADWADESVTTIDADGSTITSTRATFVGQLLDKTAQRHFYDICLAADFTLPFPHRGQTRMMGLTKWEDLEGVLTFSDRGENRNICLADEGDETSISSLKLSQLDDQELPNRVVVTFRDAANKNQERPLIFEDVAQQLRAAKAQGGNGRRVVEKKYSLLGVSELGQAVRRGNKLLDLGPFDGTTDDGGGLKNNLRIEFTTWFSHTLELHKYKVIRVDSELLEDYGFEYFRVVKLTRTEDLRVEVTAQAYPEAYYDLLESEDAADVLQPGSGVEPNPGGGSGDIPITPGWTGISFDQDRIYFALTA
jgi:hypothetical protein